MQSEVNLQMMNQFSKKERKKKKRLKTVFQLDICISDLSIRSLIVWIHLWFFFLARETEGYYATNCRFGSYIFHCPTAFLNGHNINKVAHRVNKQTWRKKLLQAAVCLRVLN